MMQIMKHNLSKVRGMVLEEKTGVRREIPAVFPFCLIRRSPPKNACRDSFRRWLMYTFPLSVRQYSRDLTDISSSSWPFRSGSWSSV